MRAQGVVEFQINGWQLLSTQLFPHTTVSSSLFPHTMVSSSLFPQTMVSTSSVPTTSAPAVLTVQTAWQSPPPHRAPHTTLGDSAKLQSLPHVTSSPAAVSCAPQLSVFVQ